MICISGVLPIRKQNISQMQAGDPIRVHKPKDKSARWPRAWPASMELPEDCCSGDLVEVLETLQACQPNPHMLLWRLPCILVLASRGHAWLLWLSFQASGGLSGL